MPEYRLHTYYNPGSRYKHVIIRTCFGLFDYVFCTEKQVEEYKDNLPELYRVSKK